MKYLLNGIIGEVVRTPVITALRSTGANFASYINLKNMEAGDSVSFWLEYDIEGEGEPVAGSSPVITLDYEEIAATILAGLPNEQLIKVAGWSANEPIVLEHNQVIQMAVLQVSGSAKQFGARITDLATGS